MKVSGNAQKMYEFILNNEFNLFPWQSSNASQCKLIVLAFDTKRYRMSLTFKNLISSFNLVTVASAFKARVWIRGKSKKPYNLLFFILFSMSRGKRKFLSILKKVSSLRGYCICMLLPKVNKFYVYKLCTRVAGLMDLCRTLNALRMSLFTWELQWQKKLKSFEQNVLNKKKRTWTVLIRNWTNK